MICYIHLEHRPKNVRQVDNNIIVFVGTKVPVLPHLGPAAQVNVGIQPGQAGAIPGLTEGRNQSMNMDV